MIGIILAGGHGKRLHPVTISTNKHLVPVGGLPMIEYPLHTLTRAGIKNIIITTGGEHFDAIAQYLGNGHERGLNIHYTIQNRSFEHAKGIAHALNLNEELVGNEDIVVLLGDNIFEEELDFNIPEGKEAKIFIKKIPSNDFYFPGTNKARFGVPYIEDNKITKIVEKPENPPNNYSIVGAYVYKKQVFDFIKTLKPSNRGELEISDVNDFYVQKGTISFNELTKEWSDAGTWKSHKIATKFINETKLNQAIITKTPILKDWETWKAAFE